MLAVTRLCLPKLASTAGVVAATNLGKPGQPGGFHQPTDRTRAERPFRHGAAAFTLLVVPGSFFAAVRRFWAEQAEIHERIVLLNRPWEEEYLHWSGAGEQACLHGQLLPPDGRCHGATRGGWCARSGLGR